MQSHQTQQSPSCSPDQGGVRLAPPFSEPPAGNSQAGLPSSRVGADAARAKRAAAMADALLELRGSNGGVTDHDLLQKGFTSHEIADLGDEAVELARVTGLRRDWPEQPMTLNDVITRARYALPQFPPVMGGQILSNDAREFWGRYCTAVSAHMTDPWVAQRERCLSRLKHFLGQLPLLPREINRVVTDVADHLAKSEKPIRKGAAS